ncbi:hypothetical protein [Compostibacter hankyongensis]|uniref:Uncharacterized protein n=1 Tax=Compostibacter hankyongensis TaxID=1007089 RepID=A0ABP8G920_9BACT
MKKITALLLLAAFVSTTAFTACTKKEVREVNNATSLVFPVAADDWTLDEDGLVYSVSFDVPELSDAVYDHGAVLVYLAFGNNDFYEALPEVFNGNSYGVIHNAGYITVDASPVGDNAVTRPGAATAKVVFIDAQLLEMHPDVDLRDYNAVTRAFRVKE